MAIIVFDYDGVLTNVSVRWLAKKMIAERNDVWIVTKRNDKMCDKDMEKVLEFIKLPKAKIVFTSNKKKIEFLTALNADMFIDDKTDEFFDILNSTNTIPLCFKEDYL